MKIHLLYFASLSETLGLKTEIIESDCIAENTSEINVSSLKKYLATRGEHWQIFLSNNNLLCAVNQTMATNNTLIEANQEVAFFPPVTGG